MLACLYQEDRGARKRCWRLAGGWRGDKVSFEGLAALCVPCVSPASFSPEERRGEEARKRPQAGKTRAGNPQNREEDVVRALCTCESRGLPSPRQGIASAPAQAAARRAVPPPEGGRSKVCRCQAPRGQAQPRSHRGGRHPPPRRRGGGGRAGVRAAATAGPGLTWGCTWPRPRAAPRSPSRAAPAPRRRPPPPPPPPPPRPPARRRRRAAAGWRRGSRGRTRGR